MLLCLILLAGSVEGAEPDSIIAQFDNDDFDIREAASEALGRYPLDWAKRFMAMSAKEDNPEIAYRLRLAARQIFFNQVTAKSREWRTLHGCLPFGGDHTNIFKVEDHDGANGTPNRVCTFVDSGYLVLWVDDSVKDKIHSRDLVMSCTEGVYWGDIKVEAEKEYTLSLRRYKEPESVARDTTYVDVGNTDYTVVEVKVTAVWKDPRTVTWMDEESIIQAKWKQYCLELEEEEQKPPEAAAQH